MMEFFRKRLGKILISKNFLKREVPTLNLPIWRFSCKLHGGAADSWYTYSDFIQFIHKLCWYLFFYLELHVDKKYLNGMFDRSSSQLDLLQQEINVRFSWPRDPWNWADRAHINGIVLLFARAK